MKNFLLIFILYLIPFTGIAQKVKVQIIKEEKEALNDWHVLDEEYNIVFSGKDFLKEDTVTFGLEANKKYFLSIAFDQAFVSGTILYSFQLEGEPIMLIDSETGSGQHIFPFFTGTRNRSVKITGGTTTTISEFPWQVYLVAGNFQCGGSIINESWILTAAHCTKNESGNAVPASEMFVKVGANNPYNSLEGKKYLVSEVIVHESYNSVTNENDIALLRLKDVVDFPNAVPVKLVSADDVLEGATLPGVMSWVTGWGLTNVNPKVFPNSLQKVQLPIVTNAAASTVWGTIPATDIMAGYRNGNKDACNGDSGGPMVVPVLGEYKQAGIVSWGSSNCNTYGGYSRVSLFETWIKTKTGIPLYYKPPPPAGDQIVCQGEVSDIYSINMIPDATAYEWRLYPADAGIISGNSERSSVLWNVGYIGNLDVLVRVTINNLVSDWSKLAVKTVRNTRLLSQSGDTVLCAGQPLTLNATAEGYNLTYNWYQNGILVQKGVLRDYTILNTNPANSGDYKCEITGSCGTVVSDIIKVTVLPLTNILSVSPDTEVPFGNDITLEVNSEGHDLSYQWEKDGILIDKSNLAQLFLESVDATDIGLYQTIVKGTCGTQTSDSVYVYVTKYANPDATEVFVWPTMTNTTFNIAVRNDDSYNIQIFSIAGLLVRQLTNCHYLTLIDISTLPKGVYIVYVSNSYFRKSVKLMKM